MSDAVEDVVVDIEDTALDSWNILEGKGRDAVKIS
jgi:hypothetical protein